MTRTRAFAYIATGLACAVVAAILMAHSPAPRPGEFNTITHEPLWRATDRGAR